MEVKIIMENKLGSEVSELNRQLKEVEGKFDLISDMANIKLDDLDKQLVGIVDDLQKSVAVHGKVEEAQLVNARTECEKTLHNRLEDEVDDMIKVIGTQHVVMQQRFWKEQ